MHLQFNFTILVFLFIPTFGNGQFMRATISRKNCDNKRLEELGKCWNTLPPTNSEEIPSNPHLLENACRLFDAGIRCVEHWTKTCLLTEDKAKLESTVDGSVQTYRVVCTDRKFRTKFLQHIRCYNTISLDWDNCTRNFFNTIASEDHPRDVGNFCCTRFRYFQCVTRVAHDLCSTEATKFLKELAKSLIQSSLPSHSSRCNGAMQVSCSSSPDSSVLSSIKLFCVLILYFLQEVLDSLPKGLYT